MKKRILTREELYEEYMRIVNEICENCDWKSTFEPKEICDIIYNIIYKEEDL